MSEAFLNRLKNKQLTNVDQYRRMQDALSKIKTEDQKIGGDKDEWKNWQLAPEFSSRETSDSDSEIIDSRSASALGLYQAMRILDKK